MVTLAPDLINRRWGGSVETMGIAVGVVVGSDSEIEELVMTSTMSLLSSCTKKVSEFSLMGMSRMTPWEV